MHLYVRLSLASLIAAEEWITGRSLAPLTNDPGMAGKRRSLALLTIGSPLDR